MKVIILAGGQQSTLNNGREGIPKPMALLGERPIIWHIMKNFSAQGFNDFVICGGYKINLIKEYFSDFYIYQSDITVDLKNNIIEIHNKRTEDWTVTIVDTGLASSTGTRIKLVQQYLNEEDFIVTYGDCISNINLNEYVKFHKVCGKIATVAVTRPSGRNELLSFDQEGYIFEADQKEEKSGWINAYTMILNKKVLKYLDNEKRLEKELISELSKEREIITYKHHGFWRAVETLRDRDDLENLWNQGKAPWKIW